MKKMLMRDIKEWIKLIMNELRSNDEVEAIYLFGSYFWDLPPTIRFRVFKEGKLLYKRDEIALQRVKVDTLKSYLDIQQMIKRHCIHIVRGEDKGGP